MIYVVDSPLRPYSHSYFMMHIVAEHTSEKINLFSIPEPVTEMGICESLRKVLNNVTNDDIVLMSWVTPKNDNIDKMVDKIADICSVVVAAGNDSCDIQNLTPAHLQSVITVGCLNKSGSVSSCSNFSSGKQLVWAPGTNYFLNGHKQHGTSVSAAVYAGILAESKKRKSPLLVNFLLDKYKQQVKKELK